MQYRKEKSVEIRRLKLNIIGAKPLTLKPEAKGVLRPTERGGGGVRAREKIPIGYARFAR